MNTFDLKCGDSLEVLQQYPDNHFDAVCTDGPYGISFMNKCWDYDVPSVAIWKEVLRVLKPGGHMLAFAGARTQHRMAVNIEDAGFEIRDMLAWTYGSGMPKSKNLGNGFGSTLKPAIEPITLARKPFKGSLENNYKEHGTGGLNIDGCRVSRSTNDRTEYGVDGDEGSPIDNVFGDRQRVACVPDASGRFPSNLLHDNSTEVVSLFPDSKGSGGSVPQVKITGYGDKNVGTGKSEYLGGERTKVDCGDGSASRFFKACEWSEEDAELYDELKALVYCAKANKRDRGEFNGHPTVKPTTLMQYLCRLITPPGGTVLDPFMGSGSTGKAAMIEGFNFVGIDLDEAYIDIARRRIEAVANKGVVKS